MKECTIICEDFGGQGVLSMGKILAYSGLMENKEVTWMPAYGPEQRGGTANVNVIVSDERISSPILSKYDTAIILNQPSLAKFEKQGKPGGIDLRRIRHHQPSYLRKDIHVYRIDAMDEANERKMAKTFNMIVLGGLLKIRPYRINRKCGESPAQNFARASSSPDSDERRSHTHRYGHHQGSLIPLPEAYFYLAGCQCIYRKECSWQSSFFSGVSLLTPPMLLSESHNLPFSHFYCIFAPLSEEAIFYNPIHTGVYGPFGTKHHLPIRTHECRPPE